MVRTKKKQCIFSLIVHLFFSFTLLIFGPYEIFISNKANFNFTFQDFWWMPIIIAVLYTLIATALCTFLPAFLSDILNTFVFAFTLCCYIQTMFLNGKMESLIGEEINWNMQTLTVNAIIWLVIFTCVFVLKKAKQNIWKTIVQFLSLSLIAMQTVALCSLLITTDTLTDEKNGYISEEGMLELSSGKNAIVFIVDWFDGRIMNSILSEQPDFLEPLTGFTYFPNATSVHSRTYPSIPYLLTGNMCYFDQEPSAYVNNAFKNSEFLPALYDNQIDVALFTYSQFIGGDAKRQMRNYVSSNLSLKFGTTVTYMLKMTLYRDMPYVIKPYFEYTANDINDNVFNTQAEDDIQTNSPPYKIFNDEWFYESLTEKGITLSDSPGNFRFYHLGSCHLNLSDPIPPGKRSFEIIYSYLDKMRALGIYEDSTIIIVADHGYSGGGKTLDLPQGTAVPLLIVKPAGASTEELKVSDAPVSHTDVIPTVLNGFSLDYSEYGETVFDIPEDMDRDRYYYYSALYKDLEGEIELREYKVSGDARQKESYQFTGNTWDIIYSNNRVAPK